MIQWNLPSYHVYGHSYGGILAFEYLKRTCDTKCLSVVLASAPTCTALVEEESQRLLQDLQEEYDVDKKQALERFRQVHECKALPIPLSLLDAYAQAGTVWRGIQAIPNYKAELGLDQKSLSQAAFLLRGQDDFITGKCMKDWETLFCDTQSMVVAGCSHHALLENEQLYGCVISTFLVNHDKGNDDGTKAASGQ
jgi:pimeloyl-ACP methyl ester carboxylesterase